MDTNSNNLILGVIKRHNGCRYDDQQIHSNILIDNIAIKLLVL